MTIAVISRASAPVKASISKAIVIAFTGGVLARKIIVFLTGPFERGAIDPTPKVPPILQSLGAILAHLRGIFSDKSKIIVLATLSEVNETYFCTQKMCFKFSPNGGPLVIFRYIDIVKKYQKGKPWFYPL